MNNDERLTMLYEITRSRIAEFKSQQWATTYCAALIYAALVLCKVLIEQTSKLETVVLNLIALSVLLAGINLVNRFSQSIVERQSQ